MDYLYTKYTKSGGIEDFLDAIDAVDKELLKVKANDIAEDIVTLGPQVLGINLKNQPKMTDKEVEQFVDRIQNDALSKLNSRNKDKEKISKANKVSEIVKEKILWMRNTNFRPTPGA